MDTRYPILDEEVIERILTESLASMAVSDQRVLVIVPDLTRTMSLPLFFRLIVQSVRALDFLVALGTHPPLDEAALNRLFGVTSQERASSFVDIQSINHAWKTPEALVSLGMIPMTELARLSHGLLQIGVQSESIGWYWSTTTCSSSVLYSRTKRQASQAGTNTCFLAPPVQTL